MSFRTKNVGATYQQMINYVLIDEMVKFMEVYVNDMLVKFKQQLDHCEHLAQVLTILWKKKTQIKLNPNKCAFWICHKKF